MEKRWILVVENYNGVKKNAVNMLYSVLSSHLNYVLPVRFSQSVTEKELCENNVIVVGEKDNEIIKKCAEQNVIKMPTQKEGYSACVGESVFEKDAQMIIIAGYDDAGVLYGNIRANVNFRALVFGNFRHVNFKIKPTVIICFTTPFIG